jgi:hypothetical protein
VTKRKSSFRRTAAPIPVALFVALIGGLLPSSFLSLFGGLA